MKMCEEMLESISASLDGELTTKEEFLLAEHLSSCPECRALADNLRQIHAVMSGMEVFPPENLAKKGMERIRAAGTAPPPLAFKPFKRQWFGWGGVAAALLLVTVGAFVWMRGDQGAFAGEPMTLGALPSMGVETYDAERWAKSVPPTGADAEDKKDDAPMRVDVDPNEPAGKQGERTVGGAESKAGGGAGIDSAAPSQIPLQPSATPPLVETPNQITSTLVLPTDGGAVRGDASGTDAAADQGPEEACNVLYAARFAANYPDAEWIATDTFLGYHLTSSYAQEPETAVLLLESKGLSQNGDYYLFDLVECDQNGEENTILNQFALSSNGAGICLSKNENQETYIASVES